VVREIVHHRLDNTSIRRGFAVVGFFEIFKTPCMLLRHTEHNVCHHEHEQQKRRDRAQDLGEKRAGGDRVGQAHEDPRLEVRDVLGLEVAHERAALPLGVARGRIVAGVLPAVVYEERGADGEQGGRGDGGHWIFAESKNEVDGSKQTVRWIFGEFVSSGKQN